MADKLLHALVVSPSEDTPTPLENKEDKLLKMHCLCETIFVMVHRLSVRVGTLVPHK